jgi:multiple sugar transport system substrate-binding protein
MKNVRRKRSIVAVLLVVALVGSFVLTGCGKGGSGSKGVTISLMTLNETDKDYFKVLAADFHKLHPDITVKIVTAPYDNFDTKLQTMVASGTAPDIFTHAQIMGYMDFYTKNMCIDLTPYINKYKFDGEALGIPKNVMDSALINGKMYGIPLNVFTSVMLYNKDLFDKAGVSYPPSSYEDKSWTYDAMIQKAKDVVNGLKDKNVYGILWEWDGNSPIQDPEYLSGKKLLNMDPKNPGFAISSNMKDPAIISAYQRTADACKNNVQLTHAEADSMMGTGDADPFLFGKIAMNVGGAWKLYSISDAKFKVGVAAIPIGANPQERSVLYTDPYVISKQCKHPDEAFQFIAFLADPKNQKIAVSKGEGTPPSSVDALSAYYDYFQKGINRTDLQNSVEGALKYGVEDVEHLVAGSGQIHDLLVNELYDMYEGKVPAAKVAPSVDTKLQTLLNDIKANQG